MHDALGERIAGHRDAVRTVERLHAALNKTDVVRALDRMNRRRLQRLVGSGLSAETAPSVIACVGSGLWIVGPIALAAVAVV
jgi:hypothetical protein